MNVLVYDASALLAVVFAEAGSDVVMRHLGQPGGEISAVNWSEIGAKLVERGLEASKVDHELAAFGLDVIAFDAAQANVAAALRASTRKIGLSLGDRCCLALAQVHGARVVTADSAWRELPGFDIVVVR